jgi:hypothetical protein
MGTVPDTKEVRSAPDHCPVTLGFDASPDSKLAIGVVGIIVVLMDAHNNIGRIYDICFHLPGFVQTPAFKGDAAHGKGRNPF